MLDVITLTNCLYECTGDEIQILPAKTEGQERQISYCKLTIVTSKCIIIPPLLLPI